MTIYFRQKITKRAMFKKLKSQVQEAVNEKLTQLAANPYLNTSGSQASSNLEVFLN